ncbi:MAG: DUF2141 domain-containing protein [Pseudomonadota bacterium]
MRKFTFLSLLLLSGSALANSLTLTVSDIRNSQGTVRVQVLAGEAAFKDEAPATAGVIVPARVPTVTVVINDLPPGDYAVRVMHDVDGDEQLSRNLLGLPTEPWAFSNNATGTMGPPSWKQAKFPISENTDHQIRLNH